jgi:hypothetical protein
MDGAVFTTRHVVLSGIRSNHKMRTLQEQILLILKSSYGAAPQRLLIDQEANEFFVGAFAFMAFPVAMGYDRAC